MYVCVYIQMSAYMLIHVGSLYVRMSHRICTYHVFFSCCQHSIVISTPPSLVEFYFSKFCWKPCLLVVLRCVHINWSVSPCTTPPSGHCRSLLVRVLSFVIRTYLCMYMHTYVPFVLFTYVCICTVETLYNITLHSSLSLHIRISCLSL